MIAWTKNGLRQLERSNREAARFVLREEARNAGRKGIAGAGLVGRRAAELCTEDELAALDAGIINTLAQALRQNGKHPAARNGGGRRGRFITGRRWERVAREGKGA